jgi:hypothetical protein
MLTIYSQIIHFTQFSIFFEILKDVPLGSTYLFVHQGIFDPLLRDFLYQYFKKTLKIDILQGIQRHLSQRYLCKCK